MDRGTSKVAYDVYLSNDDQGYTREGTELEALQAILAAELVTRENAKSYYFLDEP